MNILVWKDYKVFNKFFKLLICYLTFLWHISSRCTCQRIINFCLKRKYEFFQKGIKSADLFSKFSWNVSFETTKDYKEEWPNWIFSFLRIMWFKGNIKLMLCGYGRTHKEPAHKVQGFSWKHSLSWTHGDASVIYFGPCAIYCIR